MRVALYEAGDVDRIPWPDDEEGRFARRYLTPILREGSTFVAPNTAAEVGVVLVGDHVVPFTASIGAPAQSYVVSPLTHYVAYGQQEMSKLRAPALERVLRGVVSRLGAHLERAGFDRIVYANNWLFSTGLYPRWTRAHALAVRDALIARYPDRAVAFRSVDRRVGAELERWLLEAGAHAVFSRRVHFQEPSRRRVRARGHYRGDAALLRARLASGDYRLVPTAELDGPALDRVADLYHLLYVDKWSAHNPRYTRPYVRHALGEGLLPGQALVDRDGRVDGAYGAWIRAGVFYVPIIGYDTGLPRALGLYRMLTALMAEDARRRGALVHNSAGVSQFKQRRGATPFLEHSLVFDGHLPPARRPWRWIGALTRNVAVPLIERFDL